MVTDTIVAWDKSNEIWAREAADFRSKPSSSRMAFPVAGHSVLRWPKFHSWYNCTHRFVALRFSLLITFLVWKNRLERNDRDAIIAQVCRVRLVAVWES